MGSSKKNYLLFSMIFSTLLAAALGLNLNNKVIYPGIGKNVVVRTQAFLAGSDPGEFSVEVFLNTENDVPGDKIDDVRVNPTSLILRDNQSRPVIISIPTTSLDPGPLWICIMEKPKEKETDSGTASGSGRLTVLTRSCYQRILQSRKPLFLR